MTESKFQQVEATIDAVASIPVPIPIVSEVESFIRLFIAVEPIGRELITAVAHKIHGSQQKGQLKEAVKEVRTKLDLTSSSLDSNYQNPTE